ncbi:alpha/beta fold hydrolase [Streptomyces broussonetiae]|uniref:Alpha/beta fold hydrolase n=1 Tax=Streptomyces broussonetiae TaxID=2686304 RepID=A0A6I6MV81_9ACTN|nr:alpha/beta hydrolase [Streptomyces broussonetiae]QHA02934.1 hypothetical protein GQF42_06225 [Streptomyces broussonetiae]
MYAPDRRGHGRSRWPGQYAREAMPDDVRALPAAPGLARVDGVGRSPGGLVACLPAQRHPGVVRRPVLEDVCAPVPRDPPRVPAPRPVGELPFGRAMVRATDEQCNAPDPVWRDRMGRIAMPTPEEFLGR